jgi:hypothetical protein
MKSYAVLSMTVLSLVSTMLLAQPKPEVSEYFKSLGGGIIADAVKEPGKLYVGLNLEWVKRPAPGALLVVEFSNSKIAGKPETVEQPADVAVPAFVVKSSAYRCAVNNSNYYVSITLYSDPTKSKLLGTHKQQIEVSVTAAQWAALNLKDCGVQL